MASTSSKAEPRDDETLVVERRAESATIADRIAALTMLDGMKEATQAQKTLRLWIVGFTNAEIAVMLQTSTAVVSTNLYNERKKAMKKPAAPKGAPAQR
jgi:hypothetical protein